MFLSLVIKPDRWTWPPAQPLSHVCDILMGARIGRPHGHAAITPRGLALSSTNSLLVSQRHSTGWFLRQHDIKRTETSQGPRAGIPRISNQQSGLNNPPLVVTPAKFLNRTPPNPCLELPAHPLSSPKQSRLAADILMAALQDRVDTRL